MGTPPDDRDGLYRQITIITWVFIFCVIGTIVFYFTEWGRNIVFNEDYGRQAFFMSMACAVIGFFVLYKIKLEYFIWIVVCVSASYLFVCIVYIVIRIIDFSNDRCLPRDMRPMLFSPLIAIGAAGPFCLIEIFAVYIAKRLKKGN